MTDRLAVGIVCPYSFSHAGGVQNHVVGLAGWLNDQGHQVSILAPGRADTEMLASAGLDESHFATAGPAVPVAYNGSVARINFGPAVALRVREWLEDGGFDLVHLHEPMTPSVSLLALGQTRQPVVVTFHTATPESRAMEFAYQVLPQAASRIDEAIAVSATAAMVAQRYSGITPTVIGNGINLDDHELPARSGQWRGGDHPRLCFIGRYDEPRKGLQVMLDALPTVREVHPDLEVTVVGSGAPRQEPGVDFVGPLDDDGRNEVLAHSDVYLAPQTGRESFGIVLIEALASGAPVVASGLPAFRELVQDDDGPLADFFSPGDPEDCARALLTSLARPRDEFLARGRERAAEFDWDHLGPRIERVYTRAVEEAPVRTSTRALARAAWREGTTQARASLARTRHPWPRLGPRHGAGGRSRRSPRLME